MFALYGDQTRGVLADLLRGSSLAPEVYVQEKILRPFVKLWMELAVDQGILMEPHAQNMLIEMKNGALTGRFVVRDFGGFNIDFQARQRTGKFIPAVLPSFTGNIEKDYYFEAHQKNIYMSLHNYFEGGFLYNVEQAMNKWARAGLIKSSSLGRYTFHDMLINELSRALSEKSGAKVSLGSNYEGLREAVLELRSQVTPSVRCEAALL